MLTFEKCAQKNGTPTRPWRRGLLEIMNISLTILFVNITFDRTIFLILCPIYVLMPPP